MTSESPTLHDDMTPEAPSDDIRVGAMGTVFAPMESEASPPDSMPKAEETETLYGPPEPEIPRLAVEQSEVALAAAPPEPSSAELEAAVEEEFRAPPLAEEIPAEAEVLAEAEAQAEAEAAAAASDLATEAETEETPPPAPSAAEGATPIPPPPPPPPSPPPLETLEKDRSPGCLRDAVVVIAALLLGVGFSLLALYAINGTLDFAQHPRFKLMESDVAALRGDVDALSDSMNQAQKDIVGLDERLSELGARTDAIEARLDAVDAQLSDIEQEIENIHQNAADLEARVGDLEERINVVDQQLAETQQNLDAVSERLDQAETGIGQLDERLALTEEDLAGARERIQNLVERSQALREALSEVELQLQEVGDAALRFQRFMIGLEALVESVTTPETPTVTPTITATLTITPTETPAASGVITATPPATGVAQPGAGSKADREVVKDTPALRLFPPQSPLYRPQSGLAHIFGLVWEDANENGVPDEGERPLPDVAITLYDARGRELAVVATGEDGRYLFADLEPGLYIVVEQDPQGVESVTPNTVTVSARADGLVEVNFADR